MSLLNESFLCAVIRVISGIFCRLPYRLNVTITQWLGLMMYYLLPKKRVIVRDNLRTAFGENLSYSEIRTLSKRVFESFMSNCMDLLYIPQIKKEGFEKTVQVEGRDNVEHAMSLGKGCILLAIHSGSWELASVVGSMFGYPYSVVANEHTKAPLLNSLLNDYRRLAGAKVILPGVATREIIRALQANEIVTLVLDQGGKEGLPIDFFGKTASMSTGAIRLGLKYDVPVCPVWIERQPEGHHILKFFPSLVMLKSGDMEHDVFINTQKAIRIFEPLLRNHPHEFMWFYKVYKYTTQRDVLIVDDGKTGHMRQSQGLLEILRGALNKHGQKVRSKLVTVAFKSLVHQRLFSVYCFIAQILRFLRREGSLQFFLKPQSFQALISTKPDYVISCGTQTAGVSFILSRNPSTKTIRILKPGILQWRWFSLLLLPQHDKSSGKYPPEVLWTKVALNLITPDYLKQNQEKLTQRYSHLKSNVRSKIGILIGGNAKGVEFDVVQIRSLIRQLKEAAIHFNMDLLVTTSRRTPAVIDEVLIKELRNFDRCPLLIVANESNVPEAVGGILGLADLVIVSGESISMVSEAVSSGKKAIVFAPKGEYSAHPVNKYERFVLELNQQGYLLACSIKDLTTTISSALKQKIFIKTLDDREVLLEKIERIL